jgi:hypothetical protein
MAAMPTIDPAAAPQTGRALAARPWDGACPGCGAVLTSREGPVHAYLGASSACLELYQRRAAPSAREQDSGRVRRLLQDAYAAQHPGVPQRRSVQSVAIHLMDLCLLIEREGDDHRLVPVLGQMPRRRALALYWLEPPETRGTMTIVDALDAGEDGRSARVETWAREVWAAWAPHHATVRRWLDASRGERAL